MKFKRGFINHVCIVKFLKLLVKLDKTLKFNASMKTMEIIQDMSNMRMITLPAKSKMSLSILKDMGVIIPDPNTMKNNATTSSSSPCPSSPEAMTPKSTYHGH